MKNLLIFLFSVASTFFSYTANAQEAKLLKKGEWGSGIYEQIVEIQGLYYIKTSSNQVDVIDPNLTGSEALLGQIEFDFEHFAQVYAIHSFKDFLVVQTYNNFSIYSLSDPINISRVYSISIDAYGDNAITSDENSLYVVDSNGKVYNITYDGTNFNLEHVIHSQGDDYDNNTYISSRNLFIDDSNLYYLYQLNRNSVASAVIEKYSLDDFTLVNKGEYEGLSYIEDAVYKGSNQFVLSEYRHIYLVELKEEGIEFLNDFGLDDYYSISKLTYKDNILYAFSWNSRFRAFEISNENQVIPLVSQYLVNKYFTYSDNLNDFTWIGDQLVGLSREKGLFDVELKDNSVTAINFYYNQSGFLGKAAINENYLYLPRYSYVDIVDFTNIDNMFKVTSLENKATEIIRYDEDFIFKTNRELAHYSLISDTSFELNSKTSDVNQVFDTIRQGSFIYSLVYNDGYKIIRYDIDNRYAFYDSYETVDFPDVDNSCPSSMSFIHNELIVSDLCGEANKIHIFSQSLLSELNFKKTIEVNESYRRVLTVNDYIYFFVQNQINIKKLNINFELEDVTSNFSILSGISSFQEAEVIDKYLLVAGSQTFSLVDISEATLPKLISTTKVKNGELDNASFQIESDYVLVTTGYLGKVKFFQINKAPSFLNTLVEIEEDSTMSLADIVEDVEGDPVSYEVVSAPVNGTISVANELYTPTDNYFGEDSFTVKVMDTHENFIEQEVKVRIFSVNDAPNIITAHMDTDEDTELVELLDIIDVDGDQLSYAIDEQASYGTASFDDQGEFTYSPNANYYGDDSVVVSVTDSHGEMTSKLITISVESVNDLPVIDEATFAGIEDNNIEGQLTATDVDGQPLSFSAVAGSSNNGKVTMQSDGHFVFTPEGDYFGDASFTAQVTDSEQGVAQQVIYLTFEQVDDAPVAQTLTATVNHNSTYTGSLASTDVDGDSLQYTLLNNASNGEVSLSTDGSFTYSPNNAYSGTDSFSYEVTDGKNSVQGSVTFTVKTAVVAKSKSSGGGGSISYMLLLFLIGLTRLRRQRMFFSFN
ncbi:Ig-like domain-containing protein [Thalassotalea sp. G2M2-11]|uniref:Ig-like domain-containing protein n=1 Tax=Thalassotalea sp. G2M2-11 TaxID=2787627 RepID=UPI0019CFE6CD|nr:Ig-like domain-containing protein [Thalassotalea sp. G2M2-11]